MSAAEAPRAGIRANVNDRDSTVLEGCNQLRPDRSGRPVKTRRNRRPDRRRVKALRTYTIDEAARTLEVHRNTVRHWIKAGLRVIDDKRPILILGSDLAEYLLRRREARRQPCRAGQMFCLKCRKPQEPAGQMADFVPSSATSGALVGICPSCNHLMYRRVSMARLSEVAGALDVHLTRAQPRIEDTAIPNVNCHLGHEV
jgi:excisionase family DNA binding protein